MVAHTGGPGDARAARRLNEPRPARVTAPQDVPETVAGIPVAQVREEWRVRERWWTERPVRRRYFDVVLITGENVVVYLDETSERWYRQRA